MSDVRMIVGLGNPGKEYERTRHNIGFKVIDLLAEKLNIEVKKKKFGGLFGSGEFEGKKLILLKPLQFMNKSGEPVATAFGFFKLDISDVLVISDDLALDPGRIRIRTKGSAGGQKGLADIISKLKSNELARIRIGIGQNKVMDAASYVLAKPSPEQNKLLDQAVVKAAEAAIYLLRNSCEDAMNMFNGPDE